jgi:long-chain acyl-CoA synthetase
VNDGATAPALLQQWAADAPRRVALREKRLGRWIEVRFDALLADVRTAAAHLSAVGVGPGDRVALLATNSSTWVRWLLASQWVGAVPTAVDPEASGPELELVLRAAEAKVVVADGLAQAEDALALQERSCPSIAAVVVAGIHAPAAPAGVDVRTETAIMQMMGDDAPDPVAARPDDAAVVLWTSGASSDVRGVVLTWANLDAAARQLAHGHDLRPGADAMLVTSLAHADAFAFGVLGMLACGLRLHFPESLDTLDRDLREVEPAVLVAPPRWYARMRTSVLARAEESTPLKRFAIRSGMGAFATSGAVARGVSRVAVLRPMHRVTGLGAVEVAVCTGGPVADVVVEGLAAMDVPLTRVYGLTEAAGLVARAVGPGRSGVGTPYPGVEVRVGDDGSVEVRGPAVATRYLDGSPCIGADGWVRTGDLGRVTGDGDLEVLEVSGVGEHVGATARETVLRSLPLVGEAVAVNVDARWFALVELDESAAAAWARRKGITVSSIRDLVANPDLQQELREQVGTTVDDVRLADHPLTVAAGELTTTHKVRRDVVVERNESLFKSINEELVA